MSDNKIDAEKEEIIKDIRKKLCNFLVKYISTFDSTFIEQFGHEEMARLQRFKHDFTLKNVQASYLNQASYFLQQKKLMQDVPDLEEYRQQLDMQASQALAKAEEVTREFENRGNERDEPSFTANDFSSRRLLFLLSSLQNKKTMFMRFNEGQGLKIKRFLALFSSWDEKLRGLLNKLELISS